MRQHWEQQQQQPQQQHFFNFSKIHRNENFWHFFD
jgi:hypothetical protein